MFGPVAADLEAVEIQLLAEIAVDRPEVSLPMLELYRAGGKRLRPALVLLAAKLGGADVAAAHPAAMAVELTHAATLIHDDVIDRALTRRGRPTVAAALGNEPAIVIGDYYLVKAYELASRTHSPEVVALLARAVMEICSGEVRQYAMRYRYSLTQDEYMLWIHDKTASLLAACCDIGAVLGGLPAGVRNRLVYYGEYLGMAFQIADDVLDYTATEGEVGKPIGHDLGEGFATLPFMLAVERGVVQRLADGRHLTREEALRVAEQVRASDAPRMAIERARELAAKARDQIATIPDTDARRTLASLTEYVVSRTF